MGGKDRKFLLRVGPGGVGLGGVGFGARGKTPGRVFVKVFFVLALCLLFAPFASHASEKAEKTVEADGFASISGGNTASARDAAVGDALRKALEQSVGTIISTETMVENYQVLKDNIYTRTGGYILGYNIIDEGRRQNLYRVKVRAKVSLAELKDDLGAMGLVYARAGRPRVLFMIAEQNIGREFFYYWWGQSEYSGESLSMGVAENVFKSEFLKKGFDVVDEPRPVRGKEFFIPDPLQVVDLTYPEAGRIGSIMGAEIVVKGKAIVKRSQRKKGGRVKLYLADITVDAVSVDTGKVLASAAGHGAARHISMTTGSLRAVRKAAFDASKRLTEQILKRWKSVNLITIRLFNITDYKQVVDFKEMLKRRIRGAGAVYQRSFAGSKAVIQVETTVPAKDIADQITRFKPLSINVISTTPASIEAVVGKGKGKGNGKGKGKGKGKGNEGEKYNGKGASG